MAIDRTKDLFLSGESEENYEKHIGAEPKITDVKDPKQLLIYISYMDKKVKWLTKLSKAKGRRAEKLKENIVRFAKMEEEHIPLKITERDLEKIAYMSIKRRTVTEDKILDVLNIYLNARTHQSTPMLKQLGVNEFQFDILVLLYTYDRLRFIEFEKVVAYRKNIGRIRLRTYYLQPLEAMGLIKSMKPNPQSSYASSTFYLTEIGREKITKFAKYLINDKIHPIKIYEEYYRKRQIQSNNDLWKDFGFPLRPVGEEEAPIDRRRRVRNRE